MKQPAILRWFLLAGVLLSGASACSFLLDFGECKQDDDCVSGQACQLPQGYCIPAPVCTTSQCIQDFADNYVCGAEGTCVSLITPECTRTAGPVERDDTVIIGTILTLVEFSDLGQPIENAVFMAVDEINDSGGLPGGRRLGVISCDSSGDADQGRKVAQHLVEAVGVPAIIGPMFSGVFIENLSLITAAGTFMMSPSATSPAITTQQDDGLAWRTVASDVFQGVASSQLIRDGMFRRVVAVGKGDAYGQGLLNTLGEQVSAELGEDNYIPYSYDETTPDFGSIVVGALDEMNDVEVVVLFGTSEVVEIMQLFEAEIAERGLTIQPKYLFADGGKSEAELFAAIEEAGEDSGDEHALINRVSGTEPFHRNGAIYQAYQLRYVAKFQGNAPIYTPNAYDATYLIAYAMMALDPRAAVTGAGIADGMGLLVSGDEIEVGPTDLGDARNALSVGNSVDFAGASGPLDFDLTTGEAPANVAQWAVEEREGGDLRFVTSQCYVVGDESSGQWGPCPSSQ
jgi:branched-chain amino acid transport system substrate-binding protein